MDETKSRYEMELMNIQKQIDKIQKFKRKSYDSYMEDIISKDDYVSYSAEYDTQIEMLNQQKIEYQKKMDVHQELEAQYDEWIEEFTNYINIKKLTRDVVLELIGKIEVNHDGSIDIYYRFQNPYENIQ